MTWELAEGCTYTMTADDFRSGIVVTDAASGREYMVGETWNGLRTRAPLNVTLCGFCDEPVDAEGRCFSCMTIHIDTSLTETRGDPFGERFAA